MLPYYPQDKKNHQKNIQSMPLALGSKSFWQPYRQKVFEGLTGIFLVIKIIVGSKTTPRRIFFGGIGKGGTPFPNVTLRPEKRSFFRFKV